MKSFKLTPQHTLIKKSILILIMTVVFFSCKKEATPSREITYELTGNFGKEVNVTYTPTDGTIANMEEVVSLPWQKKVLPNFENGSVGIMVKGNNGSPNTTIIAKIFVDGLESRVIGAISDANGNFSLELNTMFN